MKYTKKQRKEQIKTVNHSFTGNKITKYSGLNVVAKYLRREKVDRNISYLFPTHWYNSTKFGYCQILLGVIMASLAGVNRISRISNFTEDSLVKSLLGLGKRINKDALAGGLKKLSQRGARTLQAYSLNKNSRWLRSSGLDEATLDADSTVSMVYGHQEGAAKGFNEKKKGAKSYHPLLVFVSELKLLYHSWFRTGSAYTSNGIDEFLKEVKSSLPDTIKKVFFRADSGFFKGPLLDLLEDYGWDYLIKVKLKNLKTLLKRQTWQPIDDKGEIAVCEFEYKAGPWKRHRTLKGVRIVKEYVEKEFLGQKEIIPVYEYACYVSSYDDKDGWELHKLYKARSTSETWIEQVKSQLRAGQTLTDDFWANDILWQLNCFAYNISVMMRYKKKKFHRQEHRTFRDWFILVPGKLVKSGHQVEIKMYAQYYHKYNWIEFDRLHGAA
jgi:hypothetical protein